MIVNHMEPDHCALIEEIVRRYPEVKVVGNAKTFGMIQQFYTFDIAERSVTVKEGETLNTGKHTLHFVDFIIAFCGKHRLSYINYG